MATLPSSSFSSPQPTPGLWGTGAGTAPGWVMGLRGCEHLQWGLGGKAGVA